MLKSITRLTRKVAFTAALLAGIAGFASTANAAVSVVTAAGSTFNLQAPFTTQFVAAYGQNVRLNLTRNGTAGNSDYMRLYAFLYQNGSYVGNVASAAATGTAAVALQQVVALPNTPGSYNQVTFAYLCAGREADTTTACDDTFDGGAANVSVLKIVPGATRTAATISTVTVAAYTTSRADTTTPAPSGELSTIANTAAVKASAVSVVSTYTGPVLTTVTKQAASNPLDMRLTFNTALAAIGDNTDLDAKVQVQVGAVDASDTGAVFNKGAVTAGDYTFKIDDANTAFNGAVDNVDILTGGSLITDEAGNAAVATADFNTITVYAAPAFASTGTAKVLLTGTGTAVDTPAELLELNSATGTGNNGETFNLTVRMAENFDGTGVDNVDDIVVVPSAADAITTVPTAGANASTFGIRITLNAEAQAIRVNPTSGVLEFTSDDTANPIVWTALTLGLTVGAGPVATADGGALTVANTPVSMYNSNTTTPTVSTLDALNGTSAGVDGILDGVKVDFIEDVGALNSTGFSIFDRVTPATTGTVTVAANSLDASIVNVTVPQATLYGSACNAGFLEASQTCATNANTASVSGTPIPYDFSLTSATSTYARVYNVTTGALQTLPNIAAAGTISDGAGPVVLKVSRSTGLTNDPEGTLVMFFSESLAANPAIGFVKTQNGSLALDILNNIDDGGTASATGARTTSTFTASGVSYNAANNTATFSDVDNDVLSGLTAVGVTAGNSGGNGFQDAGANFSGEHTIAPDAATAITTVFPTFDRAVAVVNTSGNITNVLVFLTENVTIIGTNLNQRFSLSFNGATVTPSTATISSNVINLALPGSGVSLRQVEGATNQVTYTGTVTSGVEDVDGNDLANFGPSTVEIPANSDNLFSMEIRGTVTTNGTTPVAQGTLVRADLMRFNTTRVIDRGSITVPCNCTGSTRDVAIVFTGGTSAFDSALYEAGIRNATSIPVWVTVTHDGANGEQGTGISAAVALANPGAATGQATVYLASMATSTGAITSVGTSVSGSVTFRDGPLAYTAVESARYGIVNGSTGTFRMNVGSNSSPLASGDTFVIISVRQNGSITSTWVPVTFADRSLSGYLPFAQDVKTTVAAGISDSPFIDFQNNAGNNGVLTAAFRLDRILSTDLADSTGYQLVGARGELARNSASLADFRAYRFFTTINTDTGAPYALWKFNQATDDEAFTLVGSNVRSSFSVNEHNVDNIGNSFASHYGIAYKDSGNSVVVVNRDTLFFPVSASTATSTSLAAGWHLVTVQANQSSPGFLGNTNSDNAAVGMIIEAGARRNGDAAAAVRTGVRTWIRGTTDNTLTSLVSGQAYFVYLNAADAAWTGQ